MTIRDYAAKHGKLAKDHGIGPAVASAANEAFSKGVLRPYVAARQRRLQRELTHQRHLLDALRERDRYTLLVFDAGRYDYMAPLLGDTYSGDVQRTFSAARDTFEWISKVWQGDFEDVTYLSGMVPVSDDIPDFDAEDFRRYYDGINPGDSIGEIVKLWETHWDETVATVDPETLTNVALDYVDRDKLVVHYNQPHSPYIGTPQLLGHCNNESAKPAAGRPNDEPIWHRVRAGEVSDAYLRMAYWGNAARAIEAAKPLVRERETVVATADHGEALGEWGMYTHDRAPHPKRRVVPWQRIDGLANERKRAKPFRTVNEKLEALGYV
jgi:hypothetical protein